MPAKSKSDSVEKLHAKVNALVEKAAHGDLDVGDLLTIRTLQMLLALAQQTRRQRTKLNYGVMIITLVCLFIVSFLMTVRIGDINFIRGMGTNNISVDIVATSAAFELDSADGHVINFIDNPTSATWVKVYGVSKLNVSNANLVRIDPLSNLSFSLSGDSVFVNQIEVDRRCHVNLKRAGKNVDIEIAGSAIQGTFVFDSARLALPKINDTALFNPKDPEFVYFKNDDASPEHTFKIKVQSRDLKLLSFKTVSSLSFLSEYVEDFDLINSKSSIQSGLIRLHDIERDITLSPGERVIFDQLAGLITELSIDDGYVHMKLTGEVRHIKTGPINAEREQAPTLLEYLYRNKPLAILWGALAFLWGLLTSARITLFQKTQ